ncbi:biotin carboxylase N-terminal domain-containing protein [Geodermatophilus sp. SYSU D01176]
MFTEVLVANRGESAVRAFRAAHELGAGTVAAFPWEDRNSVYRREAEESPDRRGRAPGPGLPARWCGDHRTSYRSSVAVEQIPCGPAGS